MFGHGNAQMANELIVGGSSPHVLNGGMTVNGEDEDDDDYEDEEELEESEEEEEEEDDDESNSLEEVDLAEPVADQTVVHKAQNNNSAAASDVLNHIESIAGLIDTPEAKKPVSSVSPQKKSVNGTKEEDKECPAADKENDESTFVHTPVKGNRAQETAENGSAKVVE